jgi:hypothetical protein
MKYAMHVPDELHQHNPSWEADRRSASLEIPRLL